MIASNNFADARRRIVTNGARRIERIANETADVARQLCPVSDGEHADGTPHMRDTITVQPIEGDAMGRAVRVAAPYARLVDLGHHAPDGSWVPANPFFSTATEEGRAQLAQRENLEK